MRKIGRIFSFLIPVIVFTALVIFMSGCEGQKTAKENKAIARRVFEEVWNQGNLDIVNELFAANYELHDPASPGARGPKGYKQHVTMYRTAFPDVHFTIEDQIAEGDKVATRWTASGTHQGELMGIAPTSKQATVTGIGIARIAGGKIVEDWVNWDALGLMQQIGAIPRVPDALPALDREAEDYLWSKASGVIGDPGDPEANKAIYMRELEVVFVQRNFDLIDQFVATNFVNHDPFWPQVTDFESYKQWGIDVMTANPDMEFAVLDTVAEADKVAARWTVSWTDSASGKQLVVTGMDIIRIADSKIVERWWSKDFLGLLQQLGVVPPPGQAGG